MKVNFKDTEITATVHDDTSVYVNCNYLWSLLFWQLAQQTPLNNPQSPLIHSIIPNPCPSAATQPTISLSYTSPQTAT